MDDDVAGIFGSSDMDMSDLDVLVMLQMLALASAWANRKLSRNPSFFEQRLSWMEYSHKHTTRGTFKRRLRMEKESFDILLSYVWTYLVVNEQKADMRGGAIIPELCLYCTLRWLAGGSYLDITDIAGMSKSSFYRVIWKTIMATVLAPELSIDWPKTDAELQKAIAGFASISFNQAINNCVGVVDGFLLRIKVPSKREVKNVRSYFSGHYQCHGVNVQAVTDHRSRFTFLAVAGPGVSKDGNASEVCGLMNLIQVLPNGLCVIGDAAYEPTEQLIPVYQGVDRLRPKYDNFNFYASQCRIRVEMAFGMMTNKWGILQRPVGCYLKNVKWMVQAIGRLHNFVINERIRLNGKEQDDVSTFLPSVPHQENGDPVELEPLFNHESIPTATGHSELRESMVERVRRLQLKRPAANRIVRDDDDDV